MATQDRCPNCGALVLPEEKFCRQCGAPLEGGETQGVAADAAGMDEAAWVPGTAPVTIEQLKQFCAHNEMPLEKMRFFVDQDYRQARAFGIYRDGDQFVVYKNKADGSRAVRYHGPDEAHAVNELYQKLLDECHQRNIWPDGKSEAQMKRVKKSQRKIVLLIVLMVVMIIAFICVTGIMDERRHAHDGYYRFDDDGIYYLYGSSWYYDDDYYDWVPSTNGPYADYDDYAGYYLGDDYDSEWGYSDFERSDAWEDIRERESSSHTSSDDYSSWDSGSTDWDSDW